MGYVTVWSGQEYNKYMTVHISVLRRTALSEKSFDVVLGVP